MLYIACRGSELAWALVTSHNLSKAAWGALQVGCACVSDKAMSQGHATHLVPGFLQLHVHHGMSACFHHQCPHFCSPDNVPWGVLQVNSSKLHIRHFELGALVTPSLTEKYRRSPQFGFCAHPHKPASGVCTVATTACWHAACLYACCSVSCLLQRTAIFS